MIQLCLLFFAIMLLSAAVSYWLANTTLPANALRYIYAVVVAVVLISILFDVSVVFGFPSWIFIISALLVGLGCFYYQWRKQGYFVPGLAYSSINIYSVPLMALLCGLSYIFTACSSRWGRWDAKAIWTLHALFLTYGHSWRNMFTDTIAWSHPDYPLLLSSLVAMCWKSMSIVNPLVPCVIAYLVFILVLLTVYFGLRERDRYFIGLVGLVPFISGWLHRRGQIHCSRYLCCCHLSWPGKMIKSMTLRLCCWQALLLVLPGGSKMKVSPLL
jgi:hypothetical protein